MEDAIRRSEVYLTRRWVRGRAQLMAALAGVSLAACGGPATPETEPPEVSGQGTVAPACHEVDRLEAELPDGIEPTGTTAEPIEDASLPDGQIDGTTTTAPESLSLGPEIQAWGEQEASDVFAGVWVDQELGGYAVAFTDDVDRYAAEVREHFHPGVAVAEAEHTYAELRAIQDRIGQEMSSEREPGSIRSVGAQVMINRATVGVFDPDDVRLGELSDTYGATTICFEIQDAPSPPADGLETLAKASDWRDGLPEEHGMAFAVFEVAFDLAAAEAAWRDNVPDDLEARDDELPADPGVYGDLDQVDFDRQAVVVWSSGESSGCPEWLSNIEHAAGSIGVELQGPVGDCPSDYNPYRVVLAVDRGQLPPADELPSAGLEGVPDGVVRVYPAADG